MGVSAFGPSSLFTTSGVFLLLGLVLFLTSRAEAWRALSLRLPGVLFLIMAALFWIIGGFSEI